MKLQMTILTGGEGPEAGQAEGLLNFLNAKTQKADWTNTVQTQNTEIPKNHSVKGK